MTTPTGQISASDVNTELGRASNAAFNINEGSNTALGPRFLAGIFTSGTTISMNDLRGKTRFTASGPGTVIGYGQQLGAGEITAITDAATITVSGGNSPYTYSWSYVSGDDALAFDPTSASTVFARTVFVSVAQTIILSGVYRCTVTDNIGRVISVDVTVETVHTETS